MMYNLLCLHFVLSQAASVILGNIFSVHQVCRTIIRLKQLNLLKSKAPMLLAAPQCKVQATKEDHCVNKYLWCDAAKLVLSPRVHFLNGFCLSFPCTQSDRAQSLHFTVECSLETSRLGIPHEVEIRVKLLNVALKAAAYLVQGL